MPLRRPVSPQQPMWLIHIDSWNTADPQKIIDLVPADIRPYVVFNLSISINHDAATGRWLQTEYAYETLRSWMRTCAENRVWAMIQQSSGGYQHFSETDLAVYESFYRDYPNFIGFNYAEQFWGFNDANDQRSPAWADRIALFANLLKMGARYGGYLTVSWCGNQWSPNINPMAMLKRNPGFAAACKQYTKNFILCEKYTQQSYQSDMESLCLGAYLSGFSGQYGIRYDATGWTDSTGTNASFTMGTAIAPYLEHLMLTGETVIDGPETIPVEQTRELSVSPATDGYTARRWEFYPQFYNVTADVFRKILDGTIRIPGRQEVIGRSRLAIVHNVNTGSDDNIYSTPESLFEGLYRMDGDGNLRNNKTFFKKTGRYPTIPVVYQLADATAAAFQVKVNNSDYTSRWPTVAAKTNEFNSLFPAEYTGDLYAGRHENGWVVYNPFKTSRVAGARIPFRYNTCDSIELLLPQYSGAVIKETAGQLKIYLNNYDNVVTTGLKTDVIRIYGSTAEPAWSFTDRASHQPSTVTRNWSGGVLTLTVMHNGALDLVVNCSGTATGRLTNYQVLPPATPGVPAVYTGARQYEAEYFEYKNIAGNTPNGVNGDIRNYTGQGYLRFGTNGAASIRKTVTVPQPGTYILLIKYTATGGNVANTDLYVNGSRIASPAFIQTANTSTWNTLTQAVILKAGSNLLALTANATGTGSLVLDNMQLVPGEAAGKYHFSNDVPATAATSPPALAVTGQAGTAGVVAYTDANGQSGNVFKAYTGGMVNGTGVADLDLFAAAASYAVTWKEYTTPAGGRKGMLLRAGGACPYATGMRQGYLFTTMRNADHRFTLQPYVAGAAGIAGRPGYTSSFTVADNMPCWFRATASGNRLVFECSADSLNWEGGTATAFADDLFTGGTTQLVWGLGSGSFGWLMDNITLQAAALSANKQELQGFTYIQGAGPSASRLLVVQGRSLTADVPVTAPAGYEISFSETSGYAASLIIPRIGDSIPQTSIYVRLAAGLNANAYRGDLLAGSGEDQLRIALSGNIRLMKVYTFTQDVATTAAASPPAVLVSVAASNGATAGVVSYTDNSGNTGNWLRPYSGGTRNATGVLNLDLFDGDAADYSVIWKQAVGAAGTDYKAGMLLRGVNPAGTSTTGYVQGLKKGYLFLAYNVGQTRTEFRIYKSTEATALNTLVNNSIAALVVQAGKPVWYRATVSGTASVVLRFEYSTDSLNWNLGAVTTDGTSPFTGGATQMVWGLGTANWNFYIDNITFLPVPRPGILTLSVNRLQDFSYNRDAGPSASRSFTVSGTALQEDVVLTAPDNYAISLSPGSGYGPALTLAQAGGAIAGTTVYVRLNAGLAVNSYTGNITFRYAGGGSLDSVVMLTGKVFRPAISVVSAAALDNAGYVTGYPPVESMLGVSGSMLSGNLVVTASPGFEVSLTPGTGYMAALSLTPVNDSVPLTTVYARLQGGQPVNTYNGNLVFTSPGADTQAVRISGTVTPQALLAVSDTVLTGFSYNFYLGNPPVQLLYVSGSPLAGDIVLTAPPDFELATDSSGAYNATLTLPVSRGSVPPTPVYARLKQALPDNVYTGAITVTSTGAVARQVAVSGSVSRSRVYDFSADIARTYPLPGTVPAQRMTLGTGNTTTAGVVDYADNRSYRSNCFRAFTGGPRNATGVVNLDLFPADAANYQVTWKQSAGSANTDYKAGVLLRGSGAAGTASAGYAQGLLNGYLFIVYTANAGTNPHTELRIYQSTAATTLTTLVNTSVNSLVPAIGVPVWYRAAVAGTGPVNLKLEYSTDSLHWNTGAVATDAAGAFTAGSTQLVYGLASASYDFYVDDILYSDNAVTLPVSELFFKARAAGNQVQLDWQTTSESGNRGFGIERSTDGMAFTTIGFVRGRGSASTAAAYTFSDPKPVQGIGYYRLKQTDLDGNFRYSHVEQVLPGSSAGQLVLHGNPVGTEALLVFTAGSSRKLLLRITDAKGQLVRQQGWNVVPGTNRLLLTAGTLAQGLYVVSVADEQGSYRIKMLRQ